MKKILFVCEGVTEVVLLYKILEKSGKEFKVNQSLIDNNGNIKFNSIKESKLFSYNDIEILVNNIEGKSKKKFDEFVVKFLDSRNESIKKIVFILDADSVENNNSGYKNTKKFIDYRIEKIKQENPNIIINSYITPNNKDDGMTENIIIESLKCTQITEYIKKAINDIKEMEESNIKNIHKSTLMMIAATQDPIKSSTHFFINDFYDKIIDKENIVIKNLEKFILSQIEGV